MSDKFSLDMRASPAPNGAKGGVPYASSATDVAWVPHATGTQYLQQTGDAAPGWATLPAAGYLGTVYMFADPNFATGTSYERTNLMFGGYGMVQLAPQRTWTETIANAISSPPGGWTWANSAALTSADENTTTANALRLVLNGAGVVDWTTGGTHTAPYLYKTYQLDNTVGQSWIMRVRGQATGAGIVSVLGLLLVADTNLNSMGRLGLLNNAGALSVQAVDVAGNLATATVTSGQFTTGVWLKIDRANTAISMSYSLTNSATPPTDWITYRTAVNNFVLGPALLRVGMSYSHLATASTSYDVLYYDDGPWAVDNWVANPPTLGATGFDNTGPALTIIASYNLGSASAVIVDANVQAALTEATNQRFGDTATWTFSAVRGAAPNPAASTYQAIGSVAVAGTGQYFALYGKATSTGRAQAASFHGAALRIPFTP